MMGIYFVFTLQVVSFFLIAVSLDILTVGIMGSKNLSKSFSKFQFIIILIILFLVNLKRYSKGKNVEKIVEKFKNSTLNDKLKVWHIFIFPIIIFILSLWLLKISKIIINN